MNWFKKFFAEPFYRVSSAFRKHLGDNAWILLLSIFSGVLAGFAAVLLRRFTALCHLFASWALKGNPAEFWLAPAVPALGIFLCIIIVRLFFRDKPYDKSLSGVIASTAKGTSDIEPRHAFAHIITSGITVGAGGSAGLEAPIALTCSAIGSNFAKLLHTGTETRTLLLACCGGAGISAMFYSPVAGALFACEILLPEFSVLALVPLLLSSAFAAVISEFFREAPPIIEISTSWNMMNIPVYIFLGVITGLISVYTIRMNMLLNRGFERFRSVWARGIAGAGLLYVMFLFFPALKGEGYFFTASLINGHELNVISSAPFAKYFTGSWIFWGICLALVFLKVISSVATLESGGDGGIFAPSMFIGAFSGFCVARLFNLTAAAAGINFQVSEVNFIAVGMGGMIAGVMHAPLTGMFLIAEITSGYKLLIPLMLTASIACFISKRIASYNIYKSMIAMKGGRPEISRNAVMLESSTLEDLVEYDRSMLLAPDSTLRELVKVILNSRKNVYAAVDSEGALLGILTLDSVRKVLLDSELYDIVLVYDIMIPARTTLDVNDSIAAASRAFEQTGSWMAPVLRDGKFAGFVSKEKLFDSYRSLLREKHDLF